MKQNNFGPGSFGSSSENFTVLASVEVGAAVEVFKLKL